MRTFLVIQVANLQSVKICNWGGKSLVAQMPLIGYFVPDAQRNPKIPFLFRGNAPYTLRWNVVDPTILQKAEAALAYGQAVANCDLSPSRTDCGPALRNHYGAAPHQQDRHPSIQRRFSGDAGDGEISRPKHPAPVLEAPFSQNHSTAGTSSRQPARLSVHLAPSAQLPHLRCGLHGPHYLRSDRRRSRRIQPQEARRRSYHPLLCFEAGFQEFWHGSLRPGNAGASTGAVPFLKVCLAKAPSTIAHSRMRFRMDSGFYGSRVIRFLDASGCGYVMVAREYRNIKARARACRFQALGNGWQVAEFWEKVHHKMKRRHRFVVVRRPIPQDPEDSAQRIAFYPQSLEAIKPRRDRRRIDGGIKRVGLNRGAAQTPRLCGL